MKPIGPRSRAFDATGKSTFLCSLLAAAALSVGPEVVCAGPFAYVTNVLPPSVSVIDTATNQVSAAVAFPSMSNPYAAALTPDLKKVYVTGQNGSVFVLDTASNTVAANPIAVGGSTAGIAIAPDGNHAYVASQYTSTLYVIDTGANAVSATIAFPIGTDLQNIAITPDGLRAYVTAKASNAVFVIDTVTNTLLGAPISMAGSAPLGIAITPDGREVYVTHADLTAFVSVIDAVSNTVVATIPSETWLFAVTFTPDGKFAYVTGGGGVGYTQVIDTATRGLVVTIPHGGNAVAITADGKQAYLPAADAMAVVDTATNAVTATISGLSLAQNVAARPLPAGVAVPTVAVPNVVGDTQPVAVNALTLAGFTVGTVTLQSSGAVAPGSVIAQSPAAGTTVAIGYPVALVVSTGVAVPNVVGDTQVVATNAITAAGLVLGTVAQQPSSTIAPGNVISQSPGAATNVTGGSAVSLVVSSGVAVPNVTNVTQAAATSTLIAAGLVVGAVTQQSSTVVASGSVISQSPPTGTSVAGGSAVNLVVSTGGGGGGGGGAVDVWSLLAVASLGVMRWRMKTVAIRSTGTPSFGVAAGSGAGRRRDRAT